MSFLFGTLKLWVGLRTLSVTCGLAAILDCKAQRRHRFALRAERAVVRVLG